MLTTVLLTSLMPTPSYILKSLTELPPSDNLVEIVTYPLPSESLVLDEEILSIPIPLVIENSKVLLSLRVNLNLFSPEFFPSVPVGTFSTFSI